MFYAPMALLFLIATQYAQIAEPAEPLLRDLPPGLVVESSTEVAAAQTGSIAAKLGGKIQRLTNSHVRVHGRTIQVNCITAVDETNAKTIEASLAKIKPAFFVVRKGPVVVEYVGRSIDESLALKTSYELGLKLKPSSVRYQVIAELATVDQADYMNCNPLFNHFIALQNSANNDTNVADAAKQIESLSKSFTFGKTLTLRNPLIDGKSATHVFQPPAIASTVSGATGATIEYSFEKQARRQEVPYVIATIETDVDNTGFRKSNSPPAGHLTAATEFWPADDRRVQALAQQITAGKSSNDAKTQAILEWLTPGSKLKYSGQTGSRWGALKVFEQKFGHCWDFSDCFITLARAAGVPSRQVAGWLYGSSGHVWAEFYREGQGWQQVDPTGGGKLKCGIYHIAYFTSEDGEMPIVYLGMPQFKILPEPR